MTNLARNKVNRPAAAAFLALTLMLSGLFMQASSASASMSFGQYVGSTEVTCDSLNHTLAFKTSMTGAEGQRLYVRVYAVYPDGKSRLLGEQGGMVKVTWFNDGLMAWSVTEPFKFARSLTLPRGEYKVWMQYSWYTNAGWVSKYESQPRYDQRPYSPDPWLASFQKTYGSPTCKV